MQSVRNFSLKRLFPIGSLKNLFFFKSRPRPRMNPEYVRPPEAEYLEALHWEGYIVPEMWKDDDLKKYDYLMQDIADLEQYALPVFWEFNHKAKYHQNKFYLFQWIFMFGAFFTTALAVLTTYFNGLPDGQEMPLLFIKYTASQWENTFAILTAIVSAVTSYYTLLSNHGEPRKRWANYRRLAEELRMTYFRYVSRLDPFDKPNRIDVLRKHVLNIRRKEQENG